MARGDCSGHVPGCCLTVAASSRVHSGSILLVRRHVVCDSLHPRRRVFGARASRFSASQALVERGAKLDLPDPEGVTPLISAVFNAHFDVAKYLIDQGANINRWDWWAALRCIWRSISTRCRMADAPTSHRWMKRCPSTSYESCWTREPIPTSS